MIDRLPQPFPIFSSFEWVGLAVIVLCVLLLTWLLIDSRRGGKR